MNNQQKNSATAHSASTAASAGNKGNINTALIIGFSILAFGLIMTWIGSDPANNHPDPRRDAIYAARHFVRQALHDPGSAEFSPDLSTYYVDRLVDLEPVGYRVTGTVRANNALGTLRHKPFTVQIQPSGDSWKLLTIELD